MKVLLGVLVAFLVAASVVNAAQARPSAPIALPHIDYNCDGEITIADALEMVPSFGSTSQVTRWIYDLDRDGTINFYDANIVLAEIGRVDLPTPPWCE